MIVQESLMEMEAHYVEKYYFWSHECFQVIVPKAQSWYSLAFGCLKDIISVGKDGCFNCNRNFPTPMSNERRTPQCRNTIIQFENFFINRNIFPKNPFSLKEGLCLAGQKLIMSQVAIRWKSIVKEE